MRAALCSLMRLMLCPQSAVSGRLFVSKWMISGIIAGGFLKWWDPPIHHEFQYQNAPENALMLDELGVPWYFRKPPYTIRIIIINQNIFLVGCHDAQLWYCIQSSNDAIWCLISKCITCNIYIWKTLLRTPLASMQSTWSFDLPGLVAEYILTSKLKRCVVI